MPSSTRQASLGYRSRTYFRLASRTASSVNPSSGPPQSFFVPLHSVLWVVVETHLSLFRLDSLESNRLGSSQESRKREREREREEERMRVRLCICKLSGRDRLRAVTRWKQFQHETYKNKISPFFLIDLFRRRYAGRAGGRGRTDPAAASLVGSRSTCTKVKRVNAHLLSDAIFEG